MAMAFATMVRENTTRTSVAGTAATAVSTRATIQTPKSVVTKQNGLALLLYIFCFAASRLAPRIRIVRNRKSTPYGRY